MEASDVGILSNLTYRHLFAAQILSLLGSGLTTVALGLLAFELAGADAGVVLGTALALKMVAYVGIAPIAGAFAGMVPRRTLLVALDVARATFVLFLPFVSEIWQITCWSLPSRRSRQRSRPHFRPPSPTF